MSLRLSDKLYDFERRLAQKARQVSVLEELGLTHKDYRFLRDELSGLFQQSPTQALAALQRHVRYSAAALLTLVGVYEYGQDTAAGEYWPLVEKALRVRTVPRQELGRIVERVVRLGGLASFPRAEGARRFVDLILLHGGVPNGCLDNYFDRVLRHARSDTSGRETVAAVLEPSEERYLLKPVVRYLRYGGDVAADFVERTLDLAAFDHCFRTAQQPVDGVLQEVAAAVGLHVRVVKRYRDWLIRHTAAPQSKSYGVSRSWRRPSLRLDPLQYAPVIDLPGQRVSENARGGRWTVGAGAEAVGLDVRSWRRADGWLTETIIHSAANPQTHYNVAWVCADGRASWSLPGISPQEPLLAFHGRDGEQITVADGLPRDVLWIVRPASKPFECDGAVQIEVPVSLTGAWDGYTAERWDLSRTGAEATPRIDGKTLSLRAEGDVRPYLTGSPLPGVTTESAPVFASWPRIVIPRARPDESLDQWSLRWQTADAKGDVTLSSLADDMGTGWTVDLHSAGLPALAPITVRLRGPLGRSARFAFAVWKNLDVDGTSRLALPGDDGLTSVDLSIVLPNALSLQSVEGGNGQEEDDGMVRVAVGATNDAARLYVSGSESSSYVLDVKIPRLRSHLYDAATEEPSSALATTGRLHIQGNWLEGAARPRIAFFTGLQSSTVDALEADFGNNDCVACPQVAGQAAVFGLAELAQAATTRRRGRAKLWAHIGRQRVPVGEWHARLGFQGLCAVAVESPDGVRVRAHWDRGRFIDGTQVRLWSVWTPWDAPLCAPAFADGPASCEARFGSIPAGRYLAEFIVEDPWTPAPQRRPSSSSPDVVPLTVGSAEARARRAQAGTGVRAWVTRMLAAEDGPAGQFDAWRKACAAADTADVPLLLSVAGIDAGDDLWDRMELAQHRRLFDALMPVVDRNRAAVVAALEAECARDIAAYAVALGYFDVQPQDWGGSWEPLALCGLTRELTDDPTRLTHIADRLGLRPRRAEEEPDKKDSGDGPMSTIMLADVRRARGAFGEAPQDTIATLPPELIQRLRDDLRLVPGGPLSADMQAIGYADWLFSRPRDCDASDQLAHEALFLRSELRGLEASGSERLRLAVRHALGREHMLATGGDAPAWLNVPFAVGAVAVLLRAQALDATARGLLSGRGAQIRSVALQALRVAPALFAHDLCWVHLELIDP